MQVSELNIRGFKGFEEEKRLCLSKINLLFGANSSGKSTVLQALMLLKQTIESSGIGQFDLLPNGKYVNLGGAKDIINNHSKSFKLGIKLQNFNEVLDDSEGNNDCEWNWTFCEDYKSNKINGLSLKNLAFKTSSANYSFKNSTDNVFRSSSVKSNIDEIEVCNLVPADITISIDKNYNSLMHEFIMELYNLINKDQRSTKWNKENIFHNEMGEIIECFFNTVEEDVKINEGISKMVLKKLNDLLFKIGEKLYVSPNKNVFYSVIVISIINSEHLDDAKIENLIDKYLEKEKIIRKSDAKEFLKYKINVEKLLRNDTLAKFINVYHAKKSLIKLMSSINYLGPIRERPKSIYEHNSDQNELYVGAAGQYLPSILAYLSENKITSPMPPTEVETDSAHNRKFIGALNNWIKYLGVADKVEVSIKNGLSISINNNAGILSNITNVGVGISQVLPVLSMGILSKPGDILIFEQPELHLHPYAQSKLIDFFVALADTGRQIIIETHSEYFLHRLRYKILNNELKKDDLCTLFFESTSTGANVRKAEIGEFGEIIYPAGFKDVSDDLNEQILNKQFQRVIHE